MEGGRRGDGWERGVYNGWKGKDEMKKQYEALYQRSETQDQTKVFAHFKPSRFSDDARFQDVKIWLPFYPLADLAQVELWQSNDMVDGMRKFPKGNLEIMASHLNFTFMRLQEEDKILFSADGTRACFNTGLLDRRHGCDIYAFFERNRDKEDSPDWVFSQWTTKPDAERRNLLEGFSGLPPVAEYFNAENYRELSFHLEYSTIVVNRHIIEDNLALFPPMLRDDLRRADVAVACAVDRLYDQLKRNYKLAVPRWQDGHFQLLLPLFLTSFIEADLALVVERVDAQKCYVAKTILTMAMAYQDARRIGRPNSDWLKSC